MSNVQEALKSAIKAIETGYELTSAKWKCKAALSEIEKCEPVAWMLDHIPNKGYMTITHIKDYADKEMGKTIKNNPNGFGQKYGCYPYDICIPLYDKPQPRDWVGLSESDIKELSSNLWVSGAINRDELAKVIEAKLKQLNTKG